MGNIYHLRESKILQAGQTGFGILIDHDAGYINYGVVSVVGDKIVLYLENKIRLGISSRGVGTLKEISGENLVQNDFELIGFDLVATPSTPGAYLFPEKLGDKFGENYVMKNGVYINEEDNKILKGINKFLL